MKSEDVAGEEEVAATGHRACRAQGMFVGRARPYIRVVSTGKIKYKI